MTRYQIPFFMVTDDLIRLGDIVDQERSLYYSIAGLQNNKNITTYEAMNIIPDLGVTHDGDHNQGRAFLIMSHKNINLRPVKQKSGTFKYAVDQLENRDSIVFVPNGLFEDGVLIDGKIGTTSKDIESVELYELFLRAVTSFSYKIDDFFVGPRACRLFDAGWRLTQNNRFSMVYDLKRR